MSSHQPVSVLIADDHAIFRSALRTLLESEQGFRIVGEAVDGPETVRLTRRLRPDLLLLDLAMPGLTGLETLRELKGSTQSCRAIILTAHIDNAQLVEALQTGARGIIAKDCPVELLFQGIRVVMAGAHWVGRKRVTDLNQFFRSTAQIDRSPKKPHFGLTPRELEVVCAVLAGDSNRDIAQRLSISHDTTKHHLSNIFDKLGVSNRLELALFAYNHGIVNHLSGPGRTVNRIGEGEPPSDHQRRLTDGSLANSRAHL